MRLTNHSFNLPQRHAGGPGRPVGPQAAHDRTRVHVAPQMCHGSMAGSRPTTVMANAIRSSRWMRWNRRKPGESRPPMGGGCSHDDFHPLLEKFDPADSAPGRDATASCFRRPRADEIYAALYLPDYEGVTIGR